MIDNMKYAVLSALLGLSAWGCEPEKRRISDGSDRDVEPALLSRDVYVPSDFAREIEEREAGRASPHLSDQGYLSETGGLDMMIAVGTNPSDIGVMNDIADMSTPSGDSAILEPQCPMPVAAVDCVFGMSARALVNDGQVSVMEGVTVVDVIALGDLAQRQLLFGFQCEGLFEPADARDALALSDDGVTILTIRRVNPIQLYTWLRFYMGDTEIGYIYRQNTLELVARISDQEVTACTESVGDRRPMDCRQLIRCLESCAPNDAICSAPCYRASAPRAVENHALWLECLDRCESDRDCFDENCPRVRAECFGIP